MNLLLRLAVLLLGVVTLIGCKRDNDGTAQNIEEITFSEIEPGISLESFKTVYPATKSNGDENVSVSGMYYGIEGEWLYSFSGQTLQWFVFTAYVDDIREEQFYRCKDATEKIISDYTEVFGEKPKLETGVQTFRDPLVQKHLGYTVLRATWTTASENVDVEFSFLGGERETYRFFVTVERKRI